MIQKTKSNPSHYTAAKREILDLYHHHIKTRKRKTEKEKGGKERVRAIVPPYFLLV